jgi:hypothetical protein
MRREKEQETRKKREKPATLPGSGRDADAKPSLRGVELEVVKGKLILVPSVETARSIRTRGWTLTRKDGSVVRIDTGEVVQAPKDR